MTDRMNALESALKVFVDEIVVPDRDCSCHLAPPCNWCVEHSYMAEAVENARALLADKDGRCDVCSRSPADCECHMPTISTATVTRIIRGAPVQVCPICDIAGCRHIREAERQPAVSLRITGPNADGEYWLHLKNGNGPESAGINLGGEHRGMTVSALLRAAAGSEA